MMAMRTHTRKRLLALFMAFVMIVGLLPTSVLASDSDEEPVVITVGEYADLDGVIHGDGEETWSVKDESVASVDENGRVYGRSAGETVIKHTYEVYEAVKVEAPAAPVEVAPVVPPAEVPVDGQIPAEEIPAEEIPAEETPAEETPAEETPAEETPVEETPVEGTPAEETPVEETPAEEIPVEETKAEETPAEETPAEEPKAEETPAEETPAEEPKAEETVTIEDSLVHNDNNPETPAEEPKAEEPSAEEPVEEPKAEEPAEEPEAEEPAEEPSAEEPSSEEPSEEPAEEPEAEEPSAEEPSAEEPSSEEPSEEPKADNGRIVFPDGWVQYTQTWTVKVVGDRIVLRGSESYNGVHVDVAVPEGAFPEIPELVILPVVPQEEPEKNFLEKLGDAVEAIADFFTGEDPVADVTLEDVAALLTEQVEEVTEEAPVAAFDITFYLTDEETGERVEVQPDLPISVEFSVEDSDLLGEDQTLQVYHVDSEVTEATPVKTEMVDDTTAKVETESFSIYVVTTKNDAVPVQIYQILVDKTIRLRGNSGNSDKTKNHSWTISSGKDYITLSSDKNNTATVTGKALGKATVKHTFEIKDKEYTETFSVQVVEQLAQLSTVDTVDSTDKGVYMYMFNYDSKPFTIDGGEYTEDRVSGKTKLGLATRTVDAATGFPKLKNGDSFANWFDSTEKSLNPTKANHLFLESEWKNNGDFYYNCFENFASLGTDGNFTVYDQLGTPESGDKYYYKRGNFMPYNTLDPQNIRNYNLYDGEGEELASTASRYNEPIYGFNEDNDFWFGMYTYADFYQPVGGKVKGEDMVFEFTGDDDMWVYIDGVLVLDLGGIHDAQSGYINFATGKVGYTDTTSGNKANWNTTNIKEQFNAAGEPYVGGQRWMGNTFADGTLHKIQIFYMERGKGASNLKIRFNLPTIPDGSLMVRKNVENYYDAQMADLEYTMQVKVGDKVQANSPYYLSSAPDTTLYTSADGTFSLKHNETAVFEKIPANAEVVVTETAVQPGDDNRTDYYDISYQVKNSSGETQVIKEGQAITMPAAGSVQVTVNNTATFTKNLTVTKSFTINGQKNQAAPDGFQATFELQEREGTSGTWSTVDTIGYDEFTAGSFTFQYLEAPKYYRVIETVTAHGSDGENNVYKKTIATTGGNAVSENGVYLTEAKTIAFENVYGPDTDEFPFTKQWNGPVNAGSSIVVTLKDKENNTYTATTGTPGTGEYKIQVNKSDDEKTWSCTVEGLPTGKSYSIVREEQVNGLTANNGKFVVDNTHYWTSEIDGATITNTHYTVVENDGTGSLVILKKDNSENLLPDITFTLSGTSLAGASIALTGITGSDGKAAIGPIPYGTYTLSETDGNNDYKAAGPWTVTVTKVAATDPVRTVNDDGSVVLTYNHSASVAVSGKTAAADGSYTIVNERKTVNVPVNKVWNDNNNQDGIRPRSVTVQLKADGNVVTGKTLTLSKGNSWAGSFTDLPESQNNGTKIVYTVEEVEVSGYTSVITGDATGGYTITNSHTPAVTSVSVEKVWEDAGNQDGKRPDSVTVQLKANGSAVVGKTLTLNEGNSWSGSFTNLPKYASGQVINYTVEEASVPTGYTANVTGNATSGYTITNSHTPEKVSVEATKRWSEAGGQTLRRPASITVNLLADNVKIASKTVQLTEANNWTYTWTNLDKYKAGAVGKIVSYTVTEEAVEGYDSAITGDAANGYIVTNTLVTGSFTVTKVDAESENTKLSGAKFLLTAEGYSKEVTTDANGVASFTDIPYGTYTLTESEAPANYVASTTVWTVTVDKDGNVTIVEKTNVAAKLVSFFTNPPKDFTISTNGDALTVKNTHEKGTITISKTATVDGASIAGTYTFEIYTKSGDTYTKVDEVTVTGGQSKTSEALDTTEIYYVKETGKTPGITVGNYDLVTTYGDGLQENADGYVELDPLTTSGLEISCTNAYTIKHGSLTVGKTVSGTTTVEKFTVVVKLGSGSVEVPSGRKTYVENGKYTFELADGETATITGIPYTTQYTVEETYTEPFSYVVSGEVENGVIGATNRVTIVNDYVTSGFVVNKVDEDGNLIADGSATFTLYKKNPTEAGFDPEADRVTAQSTVGGVASFSNLPAGTYYLQETSAPDNYTKDDTVWTVTVTTSGGEVTASEIGVTVEENTTLAAQVWNAVLRFFSGKDYSTSTTKPVTISTADNYKERTAVLTVKNTPINYSLTIDKTVTGVSTDRTFYFNVYKWDATTTAYAATPANGDTPIEVVVGTSTVLRTAQYPWLLAGKYQIVEDKSDVTVPNYSHKDVTYKTGANTYYTANDNEVTLSRGTQSVRVEAQNRYSRDMATLKVTKTFSGLASLPENFQIEVKEHDSGTLVATLGLTASVGVQGPDNSSTNPYTWTISVKTNVRYDVEEKNATVEDWTLVEGTVPSGFETVTEKNGEKTVPLNNVYDRDQAKLTINKDVTGDLDESTVGNSFSFNIYKQGSETPFNTEPIVLNATNGWTKTIDVDSNTIYVVKETADAIPGYEWTVKNGTTDITSGKSITTVNVGGKDANTASVTFTNDYKKLFADENRASFTINKTDGSTALDGVTFSMYPTLADAQAKTNVICTSDATVNGVTTINIPETQLTGTSKTLYLRENVPTGYVDSSKVYKVTLTKPAASLISNNQGVWVASEPNATTGKFDRTFTWTVAIDGTETSALDVTNTKIQGTISITKETTGLTTEEKNDMSFTFRVYDATGTQVGSDIVIDKNDTDWTESTGLLDYGTYTVVETAYGTNGNYNYGGVTYTGTADGVAAGTTTAMTIDGTEYTAYQVDIKANQATQTVAVTAENRYTIKNDGALTISKAVESLESGVAIPTNDIFTFTVQLGSATTDTTDRGIFTGNTEFLGLGVYTFNLKKDESATISNIPYKTAYSVSEEASANDGYTLAGIKVDDATASAASGTIDSANTSDTVAFTNTYITRSFTIDKLDAKVATKKLADAVFALYTDADLTTVYDNGLTGADKGTYTTGSDGKAAVANLPAGEYWLKETQAPTDYQLGSTVWKVTVTETDVTVEEVKEQSLVEAIVDLFTGGSTWGSFDGESDTLTVKNDPINYKLVITKTVETENPTLIYQYKFNVTAPDGTKRLVNVNMDGRNGTEAALGTYGSITLETEKYDWLVSGDYTIEEVVTDAERQIGNYHLVSGYPTYAAEEGTTFDVTTRTVTLTSDQDHMEILAQVNVTNRYERDLGNLEITKTVSGGPASASTRDYNIDITGIPETEGKTYDTVKTTADGVVEGRVTFVKDEETGEIKASVTLKHGESIVVKNLPTTTVNNVITEVYQIEEQNPNIPYYAWSGTHSHDFVTVAKDWTTIWDITNNFIKRPEENQGTLWVQKVVEDQDGRVIATRNSYNFVMTGDDVYGDPADVTEDTVRANSTVTIDGVILGDYTVTEMVKSGNGTYTSITKENAPAIEGYTWKRVEVSYFEEDGETPASSADLTTGDKIAVITNVYDRDTGSLTVEKKIDSEVESVGKNITFRFVVTGPKDANGTYSGVTFTNGQAVVEITGEGSVTMQGLPTGKYTVTERTPEYVVGMNLAISYLDTDETNAADGIVTLAKDAAAKVTVTNEYTYEDDDGPEEPDGPKEIEDPEVPLTPVEPPVEPVDPEEPGTDIPEEPGTDIPEEETPKADAPETGDATIVWILAAAVSGIGLVWLAISGKKKKDENAE